MTINPSDKDPFAGDGQEMPVEEEQETPYNFFGLRNTTPEVGPGEIQGQLEWEAEWYVDMMAGFIKQSSGEGLEAWHHYVIAFLKLYLQTREPVDAEERSSEGGYVDKEPKNPATPTGPGQVEPDPDTEFPLDKDL